MMSKKKEAKRIVFNSEKEMPASPMSLGSMLYNKTGAWRNIKPVIDLSRCIKCGICWKFCPDASIDIVDDWPQINYDYCKGCGVCAEECPQKCIAMVEEEK
ncbi:MAG: 4Fe-4S binding protein [Candidatus Saccharicenans sp.]|jgi:2-oxoisovalerate ferredoxin oxidoreductase delta subunit|nr:4Fe-4S binding protein [Candidatus Saccharicenans sp.]